MEIDMEKNPEYIIIYTTTTRGVEKERERERRKAKTWKKLEVSDFVIEESY